MSSIYPITHYVPATKPRMEAISRKSLLSMKKRSTPTTTQPTSTSRPMMPKARVARSSSANRIYERVREQNWVVKCLNFRCPQQIPPMFINQNILYQKRYKKNNKKMNKKRERQRKDDINNPVHSIRRMCRKIRQKQKR